MAGVGPSFASNSLECGGFFDEFLDFPDESCDNGESNFLCENFKDFPSIWTQSDTLPEFGSGFSENNSRSSSDLSPELFLPYENIAELEWLSNFVEDSFSSGSGLTIDAPNSVPNKVVSPSLNKFQMSSPVSVLESSSSRAAGGKVMPVELAGAKSGKCGRARSKRPRPQTFNPRPPMPLMSPSSSFTKAPQPFDGERASVGELGHSRMVPKSAHKKNKKIKLTTVTGEANQNENPNPASPLVAVRKCQHCEITKTPQWRAGPMGPKTLCNACGVRFKSGRLFPEYRPAASPTFVPSIHSNSHKKVLEMRVKSCLKTGSHSIEENSRDAQVEFIPNNNPLIDYN